MAYEVQECSNSTGAMPPVRMTGAILSTTQTNEFEVDRYEEVLALWQMEADLLPRHLLAFFRSIRTEEASTAVTPSGSGCCALRDRAAVQTDETKWIVRSPPVSVIRPLAILTLIEVKSRGPWKQLWAPCEQSFRRAFFRPRGMHPTNSATRSAEYPSVPGPLSSPFGHEGTGSWSWRPAAAARGRPTR
jgi:hypothetical protein